jgi:hypothetical protein
MLSEAITRPKGKERAVKGLALISQSLARIGHNAHFLPAIYPFLLRLLES